MIVSDNYIENIEYISKRYNFESGSIKQIYSFDYSMVKSNPEFFSKLTEELNEYKTNDMIFIDDSIGKLESARKSGIKGILYGNNSQVKNELRNAANNG